MNYLFAIVPIGDSSKALKRFTEKGLRRRDLPVFREDDFLYVPVTDDVKSLNIEYQIVERKLDSSSKSENKLRAMVNVPENLKPLIPRSFDIVGRIAIIKLPEPLLPYEKEIGSALLKANKSIDTVAIDKGVKNRMRIRDLKVIAGKESLITLHKEFGISLEMDLSKVYFSPRLATERWKVAQEVKKGEKIIDMFSGVGPFSIMIAKHCEPEKIYAIDINPDAIKYMSSNIKRNKVHNIEPICGDARAIVTRLEKVDRIIMNLPHSAFDFLETASSSIKEKGIIHYYEFLSEEEKLNRAQDIEKLGKSLGKEIKIKMERDVHTYSARAQLYYLELNLIER